MDKQDNPNNLHGRDEIVAAINRWHEEDKENRAVLLVAVDIKSSAQIASGFSGYHKDMFQALCTILKHSEENPAAEVIQQAVLYHLLSTGTITGVTETANCTQL